MDELKALLKIYKAQLAEAHEDYNSFEKTYLHYIDEMLQKKRFILQKMEEIQKLRDKGQYISGMKPFVED